MSSEPSTRASPSSCPSGPTPTGCCWATAPSTGAAGTSTSWAPWSTTARSWTFRSTIRSFRWLLSPPDEAAVVRYCEPQLEKWRHSHPSRAAATAAPTTFPTPADDFRLDVAPEAFTVVEEHSRATWTLPLEQQASD
ncbi:MAG: hypothetical protein ACYS15_18030 [Planctomycetota bacterium]